MRVRVAFGTVGKGKLGPQPPGGRDPGPRRVIALCRDVDVEAGFEYFPVFLPDTAGFVENSVGKCITLMCCVTKSPKFSNFKNNLGYFTILQDSNLG